jgi:hypothetical protein
VTDATLHILALNLPVDTRHTHLTRQQGAHPDLPPLADWIGVADLDTDRIEMFPLEDLAGMPLSTYAAEAFDLEEGAMAGAAARMDALEGAVLLVPSSAVDRTPEPGAKATLIASLPMARADHAAEMPAASLARKPPAGATPAATGRAGSTGTVLVGLLLAAALAVLIWWVLT